MPIDTLLNVLVIVTLFEMMVALGLGVTVAEIAGVATDRRLVARAALANYVGVPLVTVGLLLAFHVDPLVGAGFLAVAVCPGAPYAPPFTTMAKGNAGVAVGLMVILAASSAVVAPLLLHVLLPVMAAGHALTIDAPAMIATLLLTQLAPLGAGLAVRRWHPRLAERLQPPAGRVAVVLNVMTLATILAVHFRLLGAIRLLGAAGMLALLIACVAIGWLLGGPADDHRRTLALVTAVRNVGVGLVIVSTSFAGTPAVTAALTYGVFQTIGVALLALGWGRWSAPADTQLPTRVAA